MRLGFPRAGLGGIIGKIRWVGCNGSMSWVAAQRQICRDDAGDRQNARAGNICIMTPDRRAWVRVVAPVALSAFAVGPAAAADIKVPVKAPYLQPVYDWTGFYIGGHTGYSRGSSSAVLSDPVVATSSNSFSGVIGGVQAGYNVRFSSGLLLGVEADLTFPSYVISNSIVSSLASPRSDVAEQWDYVGTARGRIG